MESVSDRKERTQTSTPEFEQITKEPVIRNRNRIQISDKQAAEIEQPVDAERQTELPASQPSKQPHELIDHQLMTYAPASKRTYQPTNQTTNQPTSPQQQ